MLALSLLPGRSILAVVVPFESPQSASIERLASLVAADATQM